MIKVCHGYGSHSPNRNGYAGYGLFREKGQSDRFCFPNKPLKRCTGFEGDARSPKVRRASTNTLYYRRRRGPVSKPVPGLSRSRRLVTFEALSSGECCHAVTMQYRAAPSYTAHEFVVSLAGLFPTTTSGSIFSPSTWRPYRIKTKNTDKLSRMIKVRDMTIPR